jgi:hypothetical protein
VRTLKAGGLYFALVFGTGFALGTLRTLWIVPLWGARKAELAEAPLMLAVSFLAARWVVRRCALPAIAAQRLAMGGVALGFMLTAEFSLVLWLRGLTIREYFRTRDPVAETVYYLVLVFFALMPLFVSREVKS